MPRFPKNLWHVGLVLGLIASARVSVAGERTLWDDGWRFIRGDPAGAQLPGYEDGSWRSIELPHDWSIAEAPRPSAPSGEGGGYFPMGVGWYRKTFQLPASDRGRVIQVAFEGVYRNAEVWINGIRLGQHPYGYTPFRFDLTARLRWNAPNVLAVRVDNSAQPNSRWYSGSGIFRHVGLEVFDRVHLAPASLFVSTAVADGVHAELDIQAAIDGSAAIPEHVQVEVEVVDPRGGSAAEVRLQPIGVLPAPGNSAAALLGFRGRATIRSPERWDPESPVRYEAIARVRFAGRVVDTERTAFGIRTIAVSAERGLEINGRTLKLFGACLHDDNGPLGTAAFDRAEARRAELIKAAGFNAVRTAHNPPAPAFLDACDRLGLLVIDEAFDCWSKGKLAYDYHVDFPQWWRRDLTAMIERDRNHPSIVLWSLGNELPDRATPEGARTARELAAWVRELDQSRPITAALNDAAPGHWRDTDETFAALDVAGYNYLFDRMPQDHRRLPARVMVSTESFPGSAFQAWSAVAGRPYLIGDFVWSGMDYLGEAGIGRVFPPGQPAVPHWEAPQFPWHGAECGDIDITGWRKPISHYRQIVWNRGERLYLAVVAPPPVPGNWSLSKWSVAPELPSWTWPGQEGRPLKVEVYSRDDAVELELNGQAMGRAPTGARQEFRAEFDVPYHPGVLRAVGLDGGRPAGAAELVTAGDPVAVRLTADRTQIAADGQDLAFVTVEIVDRLGRLRPDDARPVSFSIEGPGTIAGIGNADMTDRETYVANPHRTYQGRAVVVVRSRRARGRIVLRASAASLTAAEADVTVK